MDIGYEGFGPQRSHSPLDLEVFRGVVHAHKMLTEIRKQRVKPDIKS
jgi:hypothetical protein